MKLHLKILYAVMRLKTMNVLYLFLSVLFFACDKTTAPTEIAEGNYKKVAEIPVPDGYYRDTAKKSSFSYYLRNLNLKESKKVYLHNGKLKQNQNAQYAVLDIDVGKRDLQQCADAVIRLRAEYLYSQKQYDRIHFKFTSGDRAIYTEYAEGFRPVVLNNEVKWAKTAEKNYSYLTFRKYLDVVFTYAGTYSLNKELKKINVDEISPGDVFIQTGHPYGHAVIVVDVATNKTTGKKAFMLAQSYMPAQDIHILKNPAKNNDPWFDESFGAELTTPEWTFKPIDLKRFNN